MAAPPVLQRTAEEEVQQLMKEFGSLVEESLIVLIHREQGYEKAYNGLVDIAGNVGDEEAAGLDFSLHESDVASSREGGRSPSMTNSATVSSWTATSDYGSSRATSAPVDDVIVLDTAAAVSGLELALKGMFPMLKDTDIRRALKEADSDATRASDILLNLKHLEETGQRLKGIDAFFKPDHITPRKGRRRNAAKEKKTGRLSVDYKLAPRADEEEVAGSADLGSTAAAPASGTSTPRVYADKAEAARQSWAVASASYATASAAFRRGRSDPLFRQVAAVYSDRGRAQAATARVLQSAAADTLVSEQSYANVVDVHYVTVDDGVRIAVERTQQWWARLGESRAKKARDEPLRVVTGSGVHSANGISRMYGEVGLALERGGWKVQPGNGHYLVTGKK